MATSHAAANAPPERTGPAARRAPRDGRSLPLLPWLVLVLVGAALLAVGALAISTDTWLGIAAGRELLQHGFSDANTWTRYGSRELGRPAVGRAHRLLLRLADRRRRRARAAARRAADSRIRPLPASRGPSRRRCRLVGADPVRSSRSRASASSSSCARSRSRCSASACSRGCSAATTAASSDGCCGRCRCSSCGRTCTRPCWSARGCACSTRRPACSSRRGPRARGRSSSRPGACAACVATPFARGPAVLPAPDGRRTATSAASSASGSPSR